MGFDHTNSGDTKLFRPFSIDLQPFSKGGCLMRENFRLSSIVFLSWCGITLLIGIVSPELSTKLAKRRRSGLIGEKIARLRTTQLIQSLMAFRLIAFAGKRHPKREKSDAGASSGVSRCSDWPQQLKSSIVTK